MKSIFDEDELLKYDSPPDDDPDDDDDDDIDWEEEEREALREQELDKQKKMQNNFSSGVFQTASPWATQPTPSSGYAWNRPAGTSPWTPAGTTPGLPGYSSPFGTPVQTGGFGWNTAPQWNSQGGAQQYTIDRRKRVIFTDLNDCLISSIDAQGKLGVPPRGISDIYIRRDVIDKIRCFGPEWIWILTNQGVTKGTDSEIKVTRMIEFVGACVADIVGLPVKNVRAVIKTGLDPYDPYTKPGTGLLEVAMEAMKPYGIEKSDTIVLGSRSGGQFQSDQDSKMASSFGVDYLDIQQLLTYYR